VQPVPALIKAFVAILLFSSAPSCVRAVSLNAYTLGVVRLGLASLAMTLLLVYTRKLTFRTMRSWDRRTWRTLIFVGLAFGLHWLFFFQSIKLANAAIGAIGFSTYGMHLLLLGWLLGFGRVTRLDFCGLGLALLGTYLLIPEFSLENEHTLGLAVGILGGLTAALLPLLHQRNVQLDVQLRTWGQFTFALPVFFLFWPETDWNIATTEWPLILYLALGIALVGHGLWVQAISVLSTTVISLLSYLYLPGSLVFGYFALGERLTGTALLGAVCVLLANALVMWSQARIRAMEARVVETV